jgi:flagellar protein FlgJ
MDISSIAALSSATPVVPAAPPAGKAKGAAAGTSAADRRKAAAQFEAILVRQLLSQSVGSMMGGTGHTAGLMYGDMMTDVLAQKISSGRGLGLAEMINKQLTPKPVGPAATFSNPSK